MKVIYRNNKFQNQLADRGWKDMRAMLDQEMPEKPGRRRPLIVWCSLLLCISFALGGYMMHQNRKAVAQPVAELIAAHSTDSNSNLLNQPPAQSAPGTTRSANFSANNTTYPPTHIAVFPQAPSPETMVTDGFASEMSIQSTVDNFQWKDYLNRLPRTQPGLMADLNFHPERIPATPVVVKKSNAIKRFAHQFNFGLTVGTILGQVKATPNLTAGIHIDYRPDFAPKWGLRTGIAYRSQQFTGESRPIIPVSFEQYYRATYNKDIIPDSVSATWYADAKRNNVLVPVNKVHRIDFPVLVYWESRFKLKAIAGANFSRAVWINSAQKSYFTYDLNEINSPSAAATTGLNSAMLTILPLWEVQLQGGLAYNINRHVEIGLHYRSNWMQQDPIVEEARDAYSNCLNCMSTFPYARQRTLKSIRPQSVLLSAQISF